jgi:hypothetical protein
MDMHVRSKDAGGTNTRRNAVLILLGLLLLAIGAPAHAAETVERPYHARGSGTMSLDEQPIASSTRIAHLGIIDYDSVTDAGGTIVAANGDTLDYVQVSGEDTDPQCSEQLIRRAERLDAVFYTAFEEYYEFTGGTGRFAEATGSAHNVVCYMVLLDRGVIEFYSETTGTLSY